jgi:hypothetical protein
MDYIELEKHLASIGYKVPSWQKAEVRELCRVIHPDEVIIQAVNGHYEGGFGLLVATNHRLLLVDRKPMFLTLDAISYGMIQEISLNYRLLNSTIHIWTSNKCLDFSSWNHTRIREVLDYAQKSIILARNHTMTEILNEREAALNADEEEAFPAINYKGAPMGKTYIPSQQVSLNAEVTEPLPVEPASLETATKVRSPLAAPLARTYARRYF